MIIYEAKPQFDQNTGRKVKKPRLIEAGYICDYSGAIITSDERVDAAPMYDVKFTDLGGCEEYWYYDEHRVIDLIADTLKLDKFEVRAHLNHGEFHFANNPENCADFSLNLALEWAQNIHTEGHVFFECGNLADALSRSRYRVIERLLEQKQITIEQLGFES